MPSHLQTVGAGHDLSRKVQELERELTAARKRERATAEILRAIRRVPTDVQSVLDAVAQSAACAMQRTPASFVAMGPDW
jgi:hypothetical protein